MRLFSTDRSVPSYYGAAKTPDIHKGKIKNTGFEIELRFNKVLKNGMRFWANTNYTYAHNVIKLKDDPALIPNYRKAQGYSQGQVWSFIDNGFIGTYDELYSVPERQSSDEFVLIGDHYIVDFNGDGVVDETNDQAPYGYTGTPEHTYNATIGWEWKGFSMFAQLYGVTGVTRDVTLTSFPDQLLTVYDTGKWWNPADGSGEVVVPRFTTQVAYNNGTQFLFARDDTRGVRGKREHRDDADVYTVPLRRFVFPTEERGSRLYLDQGLDQENGFHKPEGLP